MNDLLQRLRALAPGQQAELRQRGLARLPKMRTLVFGPDTPLPKDLTPYEALEAIVTDSGSRPVGRSYTGPEGESLSTGRIEILAAVVLPTDAAVWLLDTIERRGETLPSFLRDLVVREFLKERDGA